MPKTQCDVAKVEIDKMIKLSATSIELVSFTVPRNRLEFFQDDLYPLTPGHGKPVLSAGQWFGGSTKEPELVNLQPSGMQPLSSAAKVVREKKYTFDPNPKKEVDLKEAVLSKFYSQMATQHKDPNAENKENKEVGDDEWE
jgi:coronin-7